MIRRCVCDVCLMEKVVSRFGHIIGFSWVLSVAASDGHTIGFSWVLVARFGHNIGLSP